MRDRFVLGSALLAAGLIIAAVSFGMFFKSARSQQTLRVTGAATESFVSDVAKWRLTLVRQVRDGAQGEGYRLLRADAQRLREQLIAAGVPDSAFTLMPPSAQPMWGRDGERTGYNLQQPVLIIADQPDILEQLAIDPSSFVGDGTGIEMSQLEYFYSGIAELKHSLLGAATRDARRRAEEIATSTDARVGSVLSARAGVFQITEPYSTEVSGMGMHSTSTRRKEITVTVHADFLLK
jgi:uncharacterized protein